MSSSNLTDNNRVPPTRAAGAPNEWYTPQAYIKAVRSALGDSIELDPASTALANQTIRAKRFYTVEQDGLRQPWQCTTMWLNPPYGREPETRRGNMDIWTERLVTEYQGGNVGAAIALITAVPDRQWWRRMWSYPVCFCFKQIHFERPGLPPMHHPYGSCFVYLGRETERFTAAFSQIGTIILPPASEREEKYHAQYDVPLV